MEADNKKTSIELLQKILCQKLDLDFATEYRFDKVRKFRFDFANLENKIAIEIEGGLWVDSRHRTGAGYKKDCEKYNLATTQGWSILRYTYPLDSDQIISDIIRLRCKKILKQD